MSTHVKFTTSSEQSTINPPEETDQVAVIPTNVNGKKRKHGENINDYKWLVNTKHIDDEDHLLYKTTKVYTYKGNIVCDRKRINDKGELMSNGFDGSYHVKSIVTLTNDYSSRYANVSTSWNNDDCSVTSTGILLREAEKPSVLDGLHCSETSRNAQLEGVQNLLESLSRVQGDSHPTSAISRGLGTAWNTVKVRQICPKLTYKAYRRIAYMNVYLLA